MSKFTKSITRSYQFDGDTVTVTMQRMKRKHAMKLLPFISEPDESGNVKMTFQDQMEMLDVAAEFLPKYVNKIGGMRGEAGEELTTEAAVELISEESYFMGLVGEIVGDWTEASFMFEADEKKSDALPVSDSQESDNQEHSASGV